jgi:two-component system sensor histidine kinase CreC
VSGGTQRGFGVSLRVQLILAFALFSGLGFSYLAYSIMRDTRPRYLEAMEDGLVEDARLFAALLGRGMRGDTLNLEGLRETFSEARRRPFSARINEAVKTSMNMRLYVTGADGIVRFDSEGGRDEGRDFSRWRDVNLTLNGRYGARSTRADPSDPSSSVHFVAAPIWHEGRIVGVVSVGKPSESLDVFVRAARAKIALAGLTAAAAVALLGWLASLWITRPVTRLTRYARAVRDGEPASPPRAIGRSEFRELATAFEEMREALEGRKYVEGYVISLAHALKSPLASVRGAAELLQEDPPPEARRRFAENVGIEARRMDRLVGRMLELASLENRRALEDARDLSVKEWVRDTLSEFEALAERHGVRLEATGADDSVVRGDAFLLRQALGNLVENALDFTPSGSMIHVAWKARAGRVTLTVEDSGPGIPEYALERAFEKFFSLPRPSTGRKSTGLGLGWVKEVTRLHGGEISLENRAQGGLRVVWSLPGAAAPPVSG